MEDLYSPIIHRVNQAIRERAVDPKKTVEDILKATPEILSKYSEPPKELVIQAKPQIDSLIKIADVKPGMLCSAPGVIRMLTAVSTVPEKASGKFRRGQPEKPASGIDVDLLLNKGLDRKKNKISKDNAVPEFKQALRHRLGAANKEEELENAVNDMGQIVRSLIKESMGDKNYARAQENIGVMREQCVEFEIPRVYNDFLEDLKKQISSGALGGDRREMWSKYIMWPAQGRLGLITKSQSDGSTVTEEEAQKVRTAFRIAWSAGC